MTVFNNPDAFSHIILWFEDDRELYEHVKRKIESYGIRTEKISDLSMMNEIIEREYFSKQNFIPGEQNLFIDYKYEPFPPILFFIQLNRMPDMLELRNLFFRVPIKLVISDLHFGEDNLGGIAILSAAAASPFRPKLILFSGEISQQVKNIALNIGIGYLISKREGFSPIENIIAHIFEDQSRKVNSNEYNDLQRYVNRLQNEMEDLKNERARLRKKIKTLSPKKTSKLHRNNKDNKSESSIEINKLNDHVASLETEREIILAHQHDLVNTSSFTTQALQQICSNKERIPPVILEELERVQISAKHCDILVQSLASLTTKLNSQKSEPSSLEHVITESNQIIKSKIPDNIVLEIKKPKQIPLCSIPEPLMVRCVLNLLINSLESLPKGGRIELNVSIPNKRSRSIKLIIKDNGRGIRKENLPKVCNMNFSTKGKKLGIGLFFVKKVTNDFGGKIFIVSKRGKGTTVTLIIPIA